MIGLRNIQKSLASLQFRLGRRAAKVRRRLDAAPPVLIFQMGKVGSSSLYASLRPTWPGLIIHTHAITKDIERRHDARLVYDRAIRKGRPLFVISPVREPIGRNVSAFFQNFERESKVKYNESTFSAEDLVRIFLEHYKHDVPLVWFDKHLNPLLGIDVYSFEFPSSGVQIIAHKNINLLLMRCELPDSVKESAVRDFLNIPTFALSNANVGSQKEYGEAYRRFKQAFIAPDWYIQKMYESRFFKHFYDGTQRSTLTDMWTQHKRPHKAVEPSSFTNSL